MQQDQVTSVQCAARTNKHIHEIVSQENQSIESTDHDTQALSKDYVCHEN